jgi:peptide/nickel transport system permease protein
VGFFLSSLLKGIATVLGAITVVFVLLRVAPGDPVVLLLGQNPSEEAAAALRAQLGLDRSIVVQFLAFLGSLLRGDMGQSIMFSRPVLDLILEALPGTMQLALAAMAISLLVAIPAGVVMASRRGSAVDGALSSAILVSQSLPTFWIGIVLVMIFAVQLRVLPSSGSGTLAHLVLPAITLSTYQWALLARIVRAGMIEVLAQDYIRTARAKGLWRGAILRRHALRNMLVPVVAVVALQLGAIMSGAVITEAVFAWPGLGTLAVSAINARDYPVLQGIVMFSAVVVVALAFVADLVQAALDPRARQ